jgi:hypothetical protein
MTDGDDTGRSSALPPRSAAVSSPRARLVADLADRVRELALAGDLAGARIAQEAIAKLLGRGDEEPSPVVDLAGKRSARHRG